MKQAAKAGKVKLFFQDEAGMSNIPNVQRAWSPARMPHQADASLTKKRVNILGALDYGTNTLTHTLHEGSITRERVIAFVDTLAKQHESHGLPTIVVLDNASIHHNIPSEKLDEWLFNHKLLLWHIPPYSPELNIIEILWKHTKYHWRKFTTWKKEQLHDEVEKILCEYGTGFKIDYA
jgi:transposase